MSNLNQHLNIAGLQFNAETGELTKTENNVSNVGCRPDFALACVILGKSPAQVHRMLMKTYDSVEEECDNWLQREEGMSLVSPEAWWATKAYMKARGFDWPEVK